MSPCSLTKFLNLSRQQFEKFKITNDSSAPLIVIGNESCDLDSVVCSIGLAYFQKQFLNKFALPVMNTSRKGFKSRSDVHWHLFNRLGEGIVDSLIFVDELQEIGGRYDAILVDHHSSSLHFLQVIGIIDHHDVDDNTAFRRESLDPFKIRRVGSCATLVSEYLFNTKGFTIDRELAKFMIVPIIIDTIGLSARMGRCSVKDHKMVSVLMQIVKGPLDPQDHNKIIDAACENLTQSARNAILKDYDLSCIQLLERDMKLANSESGHLLAFSMMPINYQVKQFLSRSKVEHSIFNFLKKTNAQVLIVQSIEIDGYGVDVEIARQLAIASTNLEVFRKIADFLENCEALKLQKTSSCEIPLLKINKAPAQAKLYSSLYAQNAYELSRKDILPLLKSFNQQT